jgi:hypothetical protein
MWLFVRIVWRKWDNSRIGWNTAWKVSKGIWLEK